MLVLAGVMFMAGVVGNSDAGLLGKEETPGERFEKAMKQLADNCAKAKLKPGETGCDLLKLKPADPFATEEGRFAHSIKIPNPVPEDSGYVQGMTPEQYFNHLCKTEAGEFIFKVVEKVEGIYMMRPRKEATDYELEHLYAMEDPYGQVLGEDKLPQDAYVQPAMGKYEFLEVPMGESGRKHKRYFRNERLNNDRKFQTAIDGKAVFLPYIVAEEIVEIRKSRYGYTWRGIERQHDRESGIAGGELIVLDLNTAEVVAVRRGFLRSGWIKNATGIWWLTGRTCPSQEGRREHLFIKEVLKPATILNPGKEK